MGNSSFTSFFAVWNGDLTFEALGTHRCQSHFEFDRPFLIFNVPYALLCIHMCICMWPQIYTLNDIKWVKPMRGTTWNCLFLKPPIPPLVPWKKHKNVCCTTNVISDQIGMRENMPTVKELDSFDSSVRTQWLYPVETWLMGTEPGMDR